MKALVTGAAGQDGSWLIEHLLALGVEVHGIVRASDERDNLRETIGRVTLHSVDLGDAVATAELIQQLQPDRCFHLAAQSSAVQGSAALTIASNTSTTIHLLDAIARLTPRTRFFFAGSAEQLAGSLKSPQNEDTPEQPRSIYGLSKTMASQAVRFYRRHHGVFGVVGFLYNHESTRRAPGFLSRKLAHAAARIAAGLDDHVDCGDLDAVRDWGFAPEYAVAMNRMLDLDEPADLVLATGVGRTVRDMANAAFAAVGLDAARYVRSVAGLVRAPDPAPLVGDPARAHHLLGWRAQKPFDEMMREMVEAEQRRLAGPATLADGR